MRDGMTFWTGRLFGVELALEVLVVVAVPSSNMTFRLGDIRGLELTGGLNPLFPLAAFIWFSLAMLAWCGDRGELWLLLVNTDGDGVVPADLLLYGEKLLRGDSAVDPPLSGV